MGRSGGADRAGLQDLELGARQPYLEIVKQLAAALEPAAARPLSTVTLTGTGGVDKTRMPLEIARDAATCAVLVEFAAQAALEVGGELAWRIPSLSLPASDQPRSVDDPSRSNVAAGRISGAAYPLLTRSS